MIWKHEQTKPELFSKFMKRYLSIISEYVADVIHIKGNENIVADCPSRPTNTVIVNIFDLPEIAKQQQDDVEIRDYKEKLQSYPLSDLQLYCDTSTFHPRPFMPKDALKPIFDVFHCLSQPRYSATLKLSRATSGWGWINKYAVGQRNAWVVRKTKSTVTPKLQVHHLTFCQVVLKWYIWILLDHCLRQHLEMKPTQANSDISLHVLTEPLVGLKRQQWLILPLQL